MGGACLGQERGYEDGDLPRLHSNTRDLHPVPHRSLPTGPLAMEEVSQE